MSSWPSGTVVSLSLRPSASASERRSEPGRLHAGIIFFTLRRIKSTSSPLKPRSSPMLVTMTLRTFVLAAISW